MRPSSSTLNMAHTAVSVCTTRLYVSPFPMFLITKSPLILNTGCQQGTNVVDGLTTHCPRDPGGYPAPADPFDCVNRPHYSDCEQVDRAGAKCSLCIVRTTEPSIIDIHRDCPFLERRMSEC